jgi:DNA adenine methylase
MFILYMKYLGGKQRLGKHLAPFLKELYNKINKALHNGLIIDGYLEPFCGSCGVLKNMADVSDSVQANDYHPDLIQMWSEVQAGTFVFPTSISEEEYFLAKALPSPSAHKSFVGFGMSFGGRFFGAYAHKYMNDKKEDFCKEMVNSLKRTAPLIQNVCFTNKSYLDLQPVNKFIYCDPPYAFTKFPIKYRRDVKRYDVFDTALFWATMRAWSANNFVVVSEIVAPNDFVEIWNMDRHRSACNSLKTGKKNVDVNDDFKSSEKLFIFKDSPFFIFV